MPTHTALPKMLPYEFGVLGSPVSVNRYGTPQYRNWRQDVYQASVTGAGWSGCLTPAACSVRIRYYWHLDRRKDVDNILKAILDGLDAKVGLKPKPNTRVLVDDCEVERVVSQRTRIAFSTRLSARGLTTEEYSTALAALSAQAAVFVSIAEAPNHNKSVTR